MKKIIGSICLVAFTFSLAFSEETESTEAYSESLVDSVEIMNSIRAMLVRDSIGNSFSYQYGAINIGDDLATLVVPKGFKYLDPASSEQVMTDLWGNPPSKSLGMLFLENETPVSDTFSFAVEISFSQDGYIEDDDAEDIDYDELLEDMQTEISEGNQARSEAGYEGLELLGWASEPFYDATNKKLHWAKELQFEGQEQSTVNYDIRILGRKGVLSLNVISDMAHLSEVKQNIDPILESTHFTQGNRYSDFDPDIDEIAAYGIGGLIAGKMLLKVGFLAKFWKIILIGGAAAVAGVKKFFGKGDS